MIQKITIAALVLLATIVSGCFRDPLCDNGQYVKFNRAFVHINNWKGSSAAAIVESNTDWELSLEPPVPGWVSLSRQNGNQSCSLVITATENNTSGGYKFATVIASVKGNNTVPPARLTIVQYDSTYTK